MRDNKPMIITISGHAGHGKDSAAAMLAEGLFKLGYTVRILHYADTLKFIAKEYFQWDGKKDEKGRTMLQYLGTDVARNKNPYFWICLLDDIIQMFFSDIDYVIIPDARFENEIEYWIERDQLADCIKVIRPSFHTLTLAQEEHPSEVSLDNYKFSTTIEANNLDELRNEIDKLMVNYLPIGDVDNG